MGGGIAGMGARAASRDAQEELMGHFFDQGLRRPSGFSNA